MRPGVVCAIDWSRRSAPALRCADALAARSGLPLRVLHVTSPAPESAQRERRERLRESMREVLGRTDVPLTVDVGDPSEQLVAASRRAAVVVIGAGGRGLIRQKLSGGVSAALTRRSACPVIVVPPKARPDGGIGPGATTVLCAARDERDLACAATAACWATDLGLGICIARAVEQPPMSGGVAIAAVPPVMPLTPAERKASALQSLKQLGIEISAVAPEELHTVVVFGRPARQIEKLVVSKRAFLVVVGPRRHGALHEALFGSPTRHLLRRAVAPVMICPREAAALLAENAVTPAAPVR